VSPAGEMGSARPEHDGKSEEKVATANASAERVVNTTKERIKSSGGLKINLPLNGELWICGINTTY